MMECFEGLNSNGIDVCTSAVLVENYKRKNKVMQEELDKYRVEWYQVALAACGKGNATADEIEKEIKRLRGEQTPAGMIREAMKVVLERMKCEGLFTDEILMLAHRMCKLGQAVAEITRAETEAKQHGGDAEKAVEDDETQAPAEADPEGAGHQV